MSLLHLGPHAAVKASWNASQACALEQLAKLLPSCPSASHKSAPIRCCQGGNRCQQGLHRSQCCNAAFCELYRPCKQIAPSSARLATVSAVKLSGASSAMLLRRLLSSCLDWVNFRSCCSNTLRRPHARTDCQEESSGLLARLACLLH